MSSARETNPASAQAPAPASEAGDGDRFEFRIFRRVPGPEAAILRAIAAAGPFACSSEHYVVVPRRPDVNLKLRDGTLELKSMVEKAGPLEPSGARDCTTST